MRVIIMCVLWGPDVSVGQKLNTLMELIWNPATGAFVDTHKAVQESHAAAVTTGVIDSSLFFEDGEDVRLEGERARARNALLNTMRSLATPHGCSPESPRVQLRIRELA